ncbi:MAG: proline racemase family protein [Longimicrobiales bacterium]
MTVATAPVLERRQQHYPAEIQVIDSHTEGEPTRVVVSGWPALESRSMADRRDELRARWDHLRSAVVCEPRGHDALVGALLTEPVTADAAAGVIFFNNVGYLGMCGHGLIGVVRTLEHLGRIGAGAITIDSPVGTVGARLHEDGSVTIRNVPAHCIARDVSVDVPGIGRVVGDIAWGGNWFFITHLERPALELGNLDELSRITRTMLTVLRERGITGAEGAEIDHIELTAPATNRSADARNFVMCPGGAYDRSPCGTGTSAKLAVLHAQGALAPGEHFRQESVTGGLFTGWLEEHEGQLLPFVRGHAHVTGESRLRFHASDPFRAGFTAG